MGFLGFYILRVVVLFMMMIVGFFLNFSFFVFLIWVSILLVFFSMELVFLLILMVEYRDENRSRIKLSVRVLFFGFYMVGILKKEVKKDWFIF